MSWTAKAREASRAARRMKRVSEGPLGLAMSSHGIVAQAMKLGKGVGHGYKYRVSIAGSMMALPHQGFVKGKKEGIQLMRNQLARFLRSRRSLIRTGKGAIKIQAKAKK
jgi:hypothetical protein